VSAARLSPEGRRAAWLVAAFGGLWALAAGLSWVSLGSLAGFVPFAALLGLGALGLGGVWRLMGRSHPGGLPASLARLLLLAVLLRLGTAVVWDVTLPRWGHGTPVEQAGYVMTDAHDRDRAAWKLADSGRPLLEAFRNQRAVDQYGGLLFLSAWIYRYLGGPVHLPLQMALVSACLSALAVLFTWGLAERAWGAATAWRAAWIVALLPEAVLLGSSQLREMLTLPLTTAAFYGLTRFELDHAPSGLRWLLAALALMLPFSPPYAGLVLLLLAIFALATRGRLFRRESLKWRRFWLVIAALIVLATVGVWVAWRQSAPAGISNPVQLIGWWLAKSADWQGYLSVQASGWLQKIFRSSPTWLHLPLLTGYGVLQPFLPAALVAHSQAPIWTAILIWRAVGWTALLALLLYAPLRALQRPRDRFAGALALVVWLGIVLAAVRGGGDQWDNPRYRATFIGLQAALAAWAWTAQLARPDPWLRRALGALAWVLAWFLPWYLRRYTGFAWPVIDLFKTIGLGVACAALFWIWDVVRARPLT
jgi:hypothetical protein